MFCFFILETKVMQNYFPDMESLFHYLAVYPFLHLIYQLMRWLLEVSKSVIKINMIDQKCWLSQINVKFQIGNIFLSLFRYFLIYWNKVKIFDSSHSSWYHKKLLGTPVFEKYIEIDKLHDFSRNFKLFSRWSTHSCFLRYTDWIEILSFLSNISFFRKANFS